MDIKVSGTAPVTQTPDAQVVEKGDGTFKFTLASAITDADLQAKVDSLLSDITFQGNRLAEHMDVRDMRRYRELIREFMNEVVFRSHKFSRENFLDRKGRHRVYGLIKLIDANLDELAQELVKDEKDHISILGMIGEIRGLLKKLEEQIAGRIAAKKRIYERYADRLAELDVWMNPYDEENAEPNYQTPCMMISENGLSQARWNLRDGRWTYEYDDVHGRTCPPEISDVLEASGVDGQLVHKPLHLLPTYWGFEFVAAEEEMWDGETGCGNGSGAELATRAGACEISGTLGEGEYLFERCLCLPSDVWMTEEEQERVIEMIYDCFNSREWGRRL